MCDHCDRINETTTTSETTTSADDAAENLLTCLGCGNEIEDGDAAILEDENTLAPVVYCDDCTCLCDGCGNVVVAEETASYEAQNSRGRNEDYTLCADCQDDDEYVRRCDWCRDRYYCRDVYHSHSDLICAGCAEDSYSCECCGDLLHSDDSYFDERNERTLCRSCYDGCRASDESEFIQGYDEKISTRRFGPPTDLMIGMELEVEVVSGDRDDAAERTSAKLDSDYHILKDDGSLDCGFEIVTRPAALETHRRELDSFLAATPRALRSHDTETCGLHIHVDRARLSSLRIGKAVAFLYSHHSQGFIDFVAGRTENNYCIRDVGDTVSRGSRPKGSRYYAVNISCDTVELRIFRGSLRKETVFARLEFAHAVFQWTRDVSARNCFAENCVLSFAAFVRQERKRYPNLYVKIGEYFKRVECGESAALSV